MKGFVCPICRAALSQNGSSLVCENRHCYDISRRGYVNLLMKQSSADARHGDSREMVMARSNFLDLGLYGKLKAAVNERVLSAASPGMTIVDIGCGECYYTASVAGITEKYEPIICGIDISKYALMAGASRNRNINLAVASAYDVPVGDESADIVLNLFAPHKEEEFKRIIKSGGTLIRVFPLERHLWELKNAIYENPYENQIGGTEIDGFKCIDKSELKYKIALTSNIDIKNLFSMTPYSYKTSVQDEKKLDSLNTLETGVEFAVLTYKKI